MLWGSYNYGSLQDLQMAESPCKEWTNEKHSLFLNFMEASFVKQLHSTKTRVSSGQFKVLQKGCWKKLNFGRADRENNADEFPICLDNPWIQRFKSIGKDRDVDFQNLQEIDTQCTKFANDSHLRSQDPVCDNEEVSDQNFVDEDHGQEQSSRLWTKRVKLEVADIPTSTDQVVPIRKCPTPVESNERFASASQNEASTDDGKSENMENHAVLYTRDQVKENTDY
ncbi:hypothetical protein GIB67_017614 [Kingdonia uniflora]|uniref:Uncharacterized protein n=1 Tax=Kingdonia uniflora TaxID=39325 RepID=A0A7J7LMX7_9MAGN|nr:hypothetical protein GIB67_017614 [Kingdonia uniflora]